MAIDQQTNGQKPTRIAWTSVLKLLYPGVGVKRWLLVGTIGIAVCSVGLAYLLRQLFGLRLPEFVPSRLGSVLFMVGGVTLMLYAIYGLYRSVGPLLFSSTSINILADTIYTRRSRGRGPRIVAIGGGTGLSVLLRGLKAYTDNLTAIVTVADDGGSSGRLRREFGVLPPGDFRNCLVALSDDENLVTELFQYRFDQDSELKGHSFGNLFIAAMSEITGSFEGALRESSRVLAVHGQILPATLANLRLSARLTDGAIVRGESAIPERGGRIERLMIHPEDAEAYQPAVEAIEQAQLIVIGPGSLYTSVLPNLLVPGISEAVKESKSAKIYVCNVATQQGETDGYSVIDHVESLQEHTYPTIVDCVLVNDTPRNLRPRFLGQPVVEDGRKLHHVKQVYADLMDDQHPVRHDSTRLAEATLKIYHGIRKGGSSVGTAMKAVAGGP